jgi:hypothetical protein
VYKNSVAFTTMFVYFDIRSRNVRLASGKKKALHVMPEVHCLHPITIFKVMLKIILERMIRSKHDSDNTHTAIVLS